MIHCDIKTPLRDLVIDVESLNQGVALDWNRKEHFRAGIEEVASELD